jgi:hypothetical protein
MTSPRQVDANRRNAQLSTGPVTAEGKQRSRRNAIRHGLMAETIIDALEDAQDYAAFETAITADFEAISAVERELVLRLASLLWRLRRATSIESGLFRIQAQRLLLLRQTRRAHQQRRKIIDDLHRVAAAKAEPAEMDDTEDELDSSDRASAQSLSDNTHDFDDLTRSYIRLANLPTSPLDRLSRYEAALWRQVCQILFTLQFMKRPKPWARARLP